MCRCDRIFTGKLKDRTRIAPPPRNPTHTRRHAIKPATRLIIPPRLRMQIPDSSAEMAGCSFISPTSAHKFEAAAPNEIPKKSARPENAADSITKTRFSLRAPLIFREFIRPSLLWRYVGRD